MSHSVSGLPPFNPDPEARLDEQEFRDECLRALQALMEDQRMELCGDLVISPDEDFGLVGRIDFANDMSADGEVNRIMFWRLPDGQLAEFVGFDIPADPISP